MEITLSDKLLAYLERKNIRNLRVQVAETAVEASYCEVIVEPMTEQQVDDMKNEKYRYIHTISEGQTFGGRLDNIFVTTRGLEFDDQIHFDLKSFFGVKDITVRGIHAFRFR